MSAQATLQRQAQKIDPELFAPYMEAAHLLMDQNLVWDKDFDSIRGALALAMKECAVNRNLNPWFLEVAYRVIDTTKANA
jgi:FMN phosphatase YigB (HAD superfamily)